MQIEIRESTISCSRVLVAAGIICDDSFLLKSRFAVSLSGIYRTSSFRLPSEFVAGSDLNQYEALQGLLSRFCVGGGFAI